MEASHSVLSSDGIDDDVSTRPDSSRLSLGSSPSELSDEEDPPHGSALEEDDFALDDGDGSLTPTDKIDINDEDDIVLGGSSEALFSSDSSDTLSNAPMDMDDRVDEEDEGEEQEERQEDDPVSPSKDQENENSTTDHVQDANEDSPSAGKKPGKKRRNSDAIEQEEWDKRRASKVLNKKEGSLLAVATLENGDKEKDPPGSPKTEQENGNDEGNDRDETEKDTPSLPTKEEEQSNAKAHEDDEDGSEEYERWHTEALEALTKIEVEFARLRDKMYQEKMAELNEEALMIAQGTHPELVAMMKTIEEKRSKRIKTAEAWRKYKRMNHQQQFEGLEYQANVDFIAGKGALRRRIISSLSRKRLELDNEREKLNEPLSDADRVPDPNVLMPRKRQMGQESKELHRLQRSIGFPRAPGAEGLPMKTIEDDLNALGLTRKSNDMDAERSGNASTSKHVRHGLNVNSIASTTSLNASGPVYTNQGQLFYHGQVFRKGDQFTIVDATAGRFSAKFLSATDTEVIIQRTDGSKTRLPFAQVVKGKYQLFSKHS